MTITMPRSLDEAVEAAGHTPEATLLAGGTDLMVDINAGRVRPETVIGLGQVRELRHWVRDDGHVVMGAMLTYAEMEQPALATLAPALAQAARTVGSPQIRAAGTLGGNLGTASPAGDTLPVLAALDATVSCRGSEGVRELALNELITGVKSTALRPGEMVVSVRIPVARGPQEFLKVGPRNAMAISIAALALVVDRDERSVRCALGAVAPVPVRAIEAEHWVTGHIDWEAGTVPDPRTFETFGQMVAADTRPIDDHRSTAAYRRQAVAVCARRALMRAFR